MPSLHSQHVVPAEPATKILLSMLAKAMVDALGAPPEFSPRFSFDTITTMIPNKNFNLPNGLPPGVWTDDTSMALCLAHSLATFKPDSGHEEGGFDEHDQMGTYTNWRKNGFLSATGKCFDVGTTTSGAIKIYSQSKREEAFAKIKEQYGSDSTSPNGSLMRVLPVGLAYWRNEQEAREYARRSSTTTHPSEMCQEACEVWVGAISMIMGAACGGTTPNLSKLQVLEYFAKFPYKNAKLRDALSLPQSAPPTPEADDEKERHYRSYHPIMKLVVESESLQRQSDLFPHIPSVEQLPSSGYVLPTLVAALYSFLATSAFDEGAMFVVNLGDDADTVGAVYGGLAGCWYAHEEATTPSGSSQFWNERVKGWKDTLVKREVVEEVAEKLAVFSEKLANSKEGQSN